MAMYRLYHRRDGRFFHFDEIVAADDSEAERLAGPLRGPVESQLWLRRRLVCAFAAIGGSEAEATPAARR